MDELQVSSVIFVNLGPWIILAKGEKQRIPRATQESLRDPQDISGEGGVSAKHFYAVGIYLQFTAKLVLGLSGIYGEVLNSWARWAPDS